MIQKIIMKICFVIPMYKDEVNLKKLYKKKKKKTQLILTIPKQTPEVQVLDPDSALRTSPQRN